MGHSGLPVDEVRGRQQRATEILGRWDARSKTQKRLRVVLVILLVMPLAIL